MGVGARVGIVGLIGVIGLAIATAALASGSPAGVVSTIGLPSEDSQGITYYDKGLVSSPAPAGASTNVSLAQATGLANAIFPNGNAPSKPDVRLQIVTRAGDPSMQSVLAWVATFHHVPPVVLGPTAMTPEQRAEAETANCDLIIMFDASSGRQLLGTQICGPTAKGLAEINSGLATPIERK